MSREFPTLLTLSGLRPHPYTSGSVLELKNLRVRSNGYEAQHRLEPFHGLHSLSWPYPQVARAENETLVLYSNAVASLDESTGSLSPIRVYDMADPLAEVPIKSGGVWHVAHCPGHWFTTNGSSFLMRVGDKVLCTNTAVPQTILFAQGRLFLGGLRAPFIFSNEWKSIFDAWKTRIGDRAVTYDAQALSPNWIMWSEVAGGDVHRPFAIIAAILGGRLEGNILTAVRSQVEQGRIGFLQLPTRGEVMHLLSVDDSLVAFCKTGVYYFNTDGATSSLSSNGVLARGAVGGGGNEYLYLDTKGMAHFLPPRDDFSPGYEEYFSTLSPDRIIIVKDNYYGDYLISDGERSFILSRYGLSESARHVSAVVDSTFGVFDELSDSNAFTFMSGDMDFGYRGRKKIGWLEVQSFGLSNMKAYILYNPPGSQAFIKTPSKPLSPDGRVYLGAAATDFRVVLTGVISHSNARLEKILVRFQYADDSSVRGPRGVAVSGAEDTT